MGYDYSYLSKTNTEDEDYEQLRADWQEAIDAQHAADIPMKVAFGNDPATPEQEKLMRRERETYREMVLASGNYHLNIWGARMVGNIMCDLGLSFEVEDRPPFPQWEDYGFDRNDPNYGLDPVRDLEEWTGPITEGHLAYRTAVNDLLVWHGPEIPGIPRHKIHGSNDGWIVLPVEIEASLKILAGIPESRVQHVLDQRAEGYPEVWNAWVQFLTGAVDHNGFETT